MLIQNMYRKINYMDSLIVMMNDNDLMKPYIRQWKHNIMYIYTT